MSEEDDVTLPVVEGAPVYVLREKQVRQLRLLVTAMLLVIVGLVLVLGITLPRSNAYDELFEENLALRQRVAEIDRQMAEVDRLVLRLRLYDAQIRSLGVPGGDHGPIDEDMPAEDFEPPPEDTGMFATDLRPAEAWAASVQTRVETFLAMGDLAEPDLNAVVTELEDLRALELAMPSTWPADGRMTSGFGWRRSPFGRTWRFHSGLDIAGNRGKPIYAAAPGRVIKARYNAGYGRMIEIDHGFGISTLYGHCASLAVREGQLIDEGDRIGVVGSTGRSTGPHLHFEVRLDGHPVDPLDYLPR